MGARGPAPRPVLQVIREGNPGRKALAELEPGIQPPPEAPGEPDWDEWFAGDKRGRFVAARAWSRMVPALDAQGVLTGMDADVLTDYCICLARLDECEQLVSRLGVTVINDRDAVVKNPAATIANQYRSRLKHLEGQLGMTPVARDRLKPGKPETTDDNPFDV